MRTTSASIAVLGVATALSLCGCSSDGGSVPAPDCFTGGSGITAACAVENPAAGRTALPPKVDVGTAKATVGVVLAGTTGAGRSSDTDAELMTEAFVDDAEYMVKVPLNLRHLGVLAEPASVCAKAIEQAYLAQQRLQVWESVRPNPASTGRVNSSGCACANRSRSSSART